MGDMGGIWGGGGGGGAYICSLDLQNMVFFVLEYFCKRQCYVQVWYHLVVWYHVPDWYQLLAQYHLLVWHDLLQELTAHWVSKVHDTFSVPPHLVQGTPCRLGPAHTPAVHHHHIMDPHAGQEGMDLHGRPVTVHRIDLLSPVPEEE